MDAYQIRILLSARASESSLFLPGLLLWQRAATGSARWSAFIVQHLKLSQDQVTKIQQLHQQLTAFSNAEQQARYYKVKYYFDLNQILTPAQRQQVQDDLTKAAME